VGRAVIGVDLGGTNLRAALLTADGDIIEKQMEATNVSEGWKKIVLRIAGSVAQQREAAANRGLDVQVVGVGAPGVIQMNTGVVVKSPNFPDWNNLPLKEELECVLRLPVFIENDANAAALGEQWRGAGKGISSMIFITLGTGVGGGIVLHNKIWHGADGMAGEIGHITLIPDGRPCSCGNSGCLEMYASARGIVQSYREKASGSVPVDVLKAITSEKVYQAAQAGDPAARHAMKEMGRMLGIALAGLINTFNPEMIVLGGRVKDAWQLFIDAAREEVLRRAFLIPAQRTRIVPSLLGDDAGMIGAAAAALQRLNN
jgi:glucokinase